jgi:general secretion pathway protein C
LPVPALPSIPDVRAALDRFGKPDGLRRMVEVAIIVLLAFQAARLAWLLLPPVPLGAPAVDAATALRGQPGRLAIDAFYPDDSATAAVSTDASGLQLFAVRPASAGGSAIIAMPEAPQRAFTVGEALAPGLILAEVQSDHVVLDQAGRRSELRFAKADARPTPARPTPAHAAAVPAASASAPAAGTPAAEIDPAQLLAQMGLRPDETDGRITGYTVIPRGDGAVLRQAGLQAGDVLLSVNNEALTAERYAGLAQSLGGASSISLTYRRDGQIRSATLQAKTP